MLNQFDAEQWIKENLPPAPDSGVDLKTEIAAEGSDDDGFNADALLASMLPASAPDPLIASIMAELGSGDDGDAQVVAQAQSGDAVPVPMRAEFCIT